MTRRELTAAKYAKLTSFRRLPQNEYYFVLHTDTGDRYFTVQ
jgi:hypothetical protein